LGVAADRSVETQLSSAEKYSPSHTTTDRSIRLVVVRSNTSARWLLLASMVYLPLVFVVQVCARV
jgi:hypothetical protein